MSKIIIASNNSGTGTITVQAPVTTSNRVLTLEDANGTLSPLVLGTAQTASGTSVDFTGIPSWAKRITLMFSGVSTTGTAQPYLQLGTSGGIEITGYESGIGAISATANITNGSITVTTAFPLYHGAIVAPAVISGNLILANLSGNIWTVSGALLSGNRAVMLGGAKSLLGALTQIRLTTAGATDTFDAGTVNIMYE